VDGHATVEPALMQSKKVTITANGKVDLHTEDLTVDFDTRPREGIGVSPGMFTNPFIPLEGTLASPRIAVGAKGAASGALAAATAGASVVAQGLMDRARGEADVCKKTLVEAMRPVALADAAAH
jgi:AsmA family protein